MFQIDAVPPVDVAVAVVELVGDCVHLEAGARELADLLREDSLDELVARVEAVAVLVDLDKNYDDKNLTFARFRRLNMLLSSSDRQHPNFLITLNNL